MRQPPAKVKNRQIAFVFCFGLPSVWERSTKLRIHRSHSCNFFYRSYSRILAPYCNSSHITKAIAIEWGVKSSLYKCYMITYPSVLRSPSVFRVWAAIPSEYMALSQTFSVTSHVSPNMLRVCTRHHLSSPFISSPMLRNWTFAMP